MRLVDMHCHLDLMDNGPACAQQAAERGIGILNASVTPEMYRAACGRYTDAPTTRCAAGLHPWWLADGTCSASDIDDLVDLVAKARYVGEIGLDFGPRHVHSAEIQTAAFRRIVEACADHPVAGRVLSIHAVRSATTVLDILWETGLPDRAACIFHWFSGTSDELTRARRTGCRFSVNGHMLKTKRGREYARVIPTGLLLLETDAPPAGTRYGCDDLDRELTDTLARMAALRGDSERSLGAALAANGAELLGIGY